MRSFLRLFVGVAGYVYSYIYIVQWLLQQRQESLVQEGFLL